MSAFIVDKKHIDALLTAGLTGRRMTGPMYWNVPNGHSYNQNKLDFQNADEVGQVLLDENVKSVSHRYPDSQDDLPGRIDREWTEPYTFHRSPEFSGVAILKAIDCYEYQSCEHPEWNDAANAARLFCEALRSFVIHALPGYDTADWCIS